VWGFQSKNRNSGKTIIVIMSSASSLKDGEISVRAERAWGSARLSLTGREDRTTCELLKV
jgi:hypothetical protein